MPEADRVCQLTTVDGGKARDVLSRVRHPVAPNRRGSEVVPDMKITTHTFRARSSAAGEGARQTYMPPELDRMGKLVCQAQEDATDVWRHQFPGLYAACPTSVASLDARAVQRLTVPR